jgi:hypothetical protein
MPSLQLSLMAQSLSGCNNVVSSISSADYRTAITVFMVVSDNAFSNQQMHFSEKLLFTLVFGEMEGKLEVTVGPVL